jgi:hypothetical protein
MDEYLVQGSVGMPRGSVLRIDDGPGVVVYVWEGEVWITQDGSARDHVLGAGQWFRIDRRGAVLAQAFRRSSVSLSCPLPGSPAERISLARQGVASPTVLHARPRRSPVQTLRDLLARLARGKGQLSGAAVVVPS